MFHKFPLDFHLRCWKRGIATNKTNNRYTVSKFHLMSSAFQIFLYGYHYRFPLERKFKTFSMTVTLPEVLAV